MDDNPKTWADLFRWVMSNPDKGALFLVIIAGAGRWLRELWHEGKEAVQHETFTESLIRERTGLNEDNVKLRDENKKLRDELRELINARRRDPPSGRP
jgi:hypothetical protein